MIALLTIAIFIILFFVYCCCRVASLYDSRDEEGLNQYKEYKRKDKENERRGK